MKPRKQNRRIRLAVVLGLAAIAIAACSNPLVAEMQSRIEGDVAAELAGDSPQLLSSSPSVDAADVPTSAVITATFDIDLDESTITAANVLLLEMPAGTETPGTLSYDGATKTVTFTPSSRLNLETEYELVVTTSLTSAQGAAIAAEARAGFVTRYFHDDEIGLDLTYASSDLVLNASAPLYLSIATVPYPAGGGAGTLVDLTSDPIEASGKVRIAQSTIPGQTASAVVLLFHDVNGSGENDAGDTQRVVSVGATGNMEDTEDLVIFVQDGVDGPPLEENGFWVIKEQYILDVGTGYAIAYQDGSPVPADGFEPIEIAGPASSREITHGVTETARNLHALDDVDFLRFTPVATDYYEINVGATSSDLRVALFDSDSDALNNSNFTASSTGTSARAINPGGTRLVAGTEYYLRVNGPTSYLGVYEIGYAYAPVAPDAQEDGDDLKTGATALPLGVGSPVTRTMEAGDDDWFEVQLVEDTSYIVTFTEDTEYFGFGLDERELDPEFRIEMAGSTSSTNVYRELDDRTLFIEYPWAGTDTYYIRVSNVSTDIGNDTPTGRYTISLSYGPDGADQFDNPDTPEDEYAWNNELGSNFTSVPYMPYGTDGRVRTIYSGEIGEAPETDVDWLSVDVNDIYDYYLFTVQPEGTTDAVVVDFEVFPSMYDGADIVPDTAAAVAGGSWWPSDNTIRGGTMYPLTARSYVDVNSPSSLETRYWIRVVRDATWPSNPLTGRYRVTVQYAPDWQDDYYLSTAVTDYEQDMRDGTGAVFYTGGIDETPYMGILNQQTPGTSFSDRNEIQEPANIGSYDVIFNSIFRKNYSGNGDPDGVTDPSTDHEFFWFQLDGTTLPGGDFLILGFSNSIPEIPLTLTYWEITPAQFGSAIGDELITETELDGLDTATVINSTYSVDDIAEKIEQQVTPGALDNYFFFKIERDDTRTTYVDPDGATRTYAQTGGYRLMFWR